MNKTKCALFTVLALFILAALSAAVYAAIEDVGTSEVQSKVKFSDVPENAWYADAAAYVKNNGLMQGTDAEKFEPQKTVTRAMLASVLYRIAGTPAALGTDPFSDTKEGAWYSDGVLWAEESGIMQGYGNGKFGINDPVSRE